MTDPHTLDRHDFAAAQDMGTTMALEVAITALLAAHPNRETLAAAWRDAEDTGFTWTSDPEPGVGAQREAWVKEAYLHTLARLRAVALSP